MWYLLKKSLLTRFLAQNTVLMENFEKREKEKKKVSLVMEN